MVDKSRFWKDKELVYHAKDTEPEPKRGEVEYQQQEDSIVWDKKHFGQVITFRAEAIRQERTGIHARLGISLDGEVLSWGYCNIEKSDERIRLANAADRQKANTVVYPKDELCSDLNRFCIGLWDAYLAKFMAEPMYGDEESLQLSFILEPYIPEGAGVILFSPPGRGKSYSALFMSVMIDAGVSTFWKVNQAKVLLINLERSPKSLRRRLAKVNEILGLERTRPLLTINARGRSLSDVMAACRKSIQEHDVKLIILDSISRAGFGDLTENRPVNAIIDALSSLCPTWLALAHTPRANEEHVYGSIHFEAGADVIIQLLSELKDSTLGIGFQVTKANDLPKVPLSIYALEFDTLGLTNARKARKLEFPSIEDKEKKSLDDVVMDYILEEETADATATQVAKALGCSRPYVANLLRNSGKFVQTRIIGKEVFYGIKARE